MDEAEFARVTAAHRHELRVHCYRMLGSYDDAEDLVQETFLKAWKGIDGFAGRSSARTWLYRIATNACLDFLDGRKRRILPDELPADTESAPDAAWLQPFPEPDAAAEARETVELAFLIAMQHLPPRQRAALILRDVLGWPAAQTADLLEASVASTNSALQRARDTMRSHLPAGRLDWAPPVAPTDEDRALVRRYMAAMERADLSAIAELLAEEVRSTMPPIPQWFQGRAANVAALAASWDPGSPIWVGRFHTALTRANGRLAVVSWTSTDGVAFNAFAVTVLRLAGDQVVEQTAFHDPQLFPAFGLPMTFPAGGRLPGKDDLRR